MKIKKAIIPVAWLWTRFLPVTKSNPKEVLPIIDKPVIHYIVEEAINSWIEEIILVTWKWKRAIEDYFDRSFEIENILEKKWKIKILNEIKKFEKSVKITYVRQGEPLWDGHAILCAKHCISEWEDFVVLFWDEIIYNPQNPSVKQLLDIYEKENSSVIWVKQVEWDKIEKYWAIKIKEEVWEWIFEIWWITEKPKQKEAPSQFWAIWKYVLKYDIFDFIKNWKKSKDWELRLVDWLIQSLQSKKLFAKNLEWERFDTGSKLWLLQANIFYWLKNSEIWEELREYLKKI